MYSTFTLQYSHDGGWGMFRHSYKGSTALPSDPQASTAPRQPKYTQKQATSAVNLS